MGQVWNEEKMGINTPKQVCNERLFIKKCHFSPFARQLFFVKPLTGAKTCAIINESLFRSFHTWYTENNEEKRKNKDEVCYD